MPRGHRRRCRAPDSPPHDVGARGPTVRRPRGRDCRGARCVVARRRVGRWVKRVWVRRPSARRPSARRRSRPRRLPRHVGRHPVDARARCRPPGGRGRRRATPLRRGAPSPRHRGCLPRRRFGPPAVAHGALPHGIAAARRDQPRRNKPGLGRPRSIRPRSARRPRDRRRARARIRDPRCRHMGGSGVGAQRGDGCLNTTHREGARR